MKNAQLPTSCIKYLGLSGYLKYTAPHQLLLRLTETRWKPKFWRYWITTRHCCVKRLWRHCKWI